MMASSFQYGAVRPKRYPASSRKVPGAQISKTSNPASCTGQDPSDGRSIKSQRRQRRGDDDNDDEDEDQDHHRRRHRHHRRHKEGMP